MTSLLVDSAPLSGEVLINKKTFKHYIVERCLFKKDSIDVFICGAIKPCAQTYPKKTFTCQKSKSCSLKKTVGNEETLELNFNSKSVFVYPIDSIKFNPTTMGQIVKSGEIQKHEIWVAVMGEMTQPDLSWIKKYPSVRNVFLEKNVDQAGYLVEPYLKEPYLGVSLSKESKKVLNRILLKHLG